MITADVKNDRYVFEDLEGKKKILDTMMFITH
jgi:hypothetical protein